MIFGEIVYEEAEITNINQLEFLSVNLIVSIFTLV